VFRETVIFSHHGIENDCFPGTSASDKEDIDVVNIEQRAYNDSERVVHAELVDGLWFILGYEGHVVGGGGRRRHCLG